MKNAWLDTLWAFQTVRGLVMRGQFRTEFSEGAGGCVVDFGCLDAPENLPQGFARWTNSEILGGYATSPMVFRGGTRWHDDDRGLDSIPQFAEYHGEELLFLVYRLGVLNKCRQYTFDGVPALLKWAQRAPYSREVLEVQVAIDRQRIGSMFVRPGRILESLADFNRWHSGRVA